MSWISKVSKLFPRATDPGLSEDRQAPSDVPHVAAPIEENHESTMTFNVAEEVQRFFDDSSLSQSIQPVFKVFLGSIATGKTSARRLQCAQGFVVVDASEVFLYLSRGGVYDFPSFLAEPMQIVGTLVARDALVERRHIVTEFLGDNADELKELFNGVTALGYRLDIQVMTCDFDEAKRRNQARDLDCISTYYAQSFNLSWLQAAAATALTHAGAG